MSQPDSADIEQLIADFRQSGLRELHVRHDGLEIYLSNDADAAGLDGGGSAQVSAAPAGAASSAAADRPAAATPATAPAPVDLPAGAVTVLAPYLGTFYRSPKPGSDPYVEVGQRVEAETELCLVEVMKLFTAVRAGTTGTIHAVLASDGAMVTADQPLFVILPA